MAREVTRNFPSAETADRFRIYRRWATGRGIDAARKVVQLPEAMAHEVLTRHLVGDDAWEADRSISTQDIYRRDMTWLQQCDLFIAEVSGVFFGLGLETGYLLRATNKKVILL